MMDNSVLEILREISKKNDAIIELLKGIDMSLDSIESDAGDIYSIKLELEDVNSNIKKLEL